LAIARATAEQTARMVQEIDVVLADQAAAPDRLRADVTRFPFVHSMELFDHNGHMLASTSATAHTDVDYHERLFFTTLQHAAAGTLYIGKPAGQDYRTFALGRAIRWRDGAFAGVVLARVAFEYLTDFYSTISVDS